MMTPFDVGALVIGSPTSGRALKQHARILNGYADGDLLDQSGEAYLSHFAYGVEMQRHYAANRNSVAGYAGPSWCRWLTLDIDSENLSDALRDVRQLVRFLHQQYPETDGRVPVYFSGGKGFHVLLELAHHPPPAVGFHRTARTFALCLANRAGVRIDPSIYDIAHIIRLPNTRHPKSGLFKRRIETDALFQLDIDGIKRHAACPAGDGIPTVDIAPANLGRDWTLAQQQVTAEADRRAATYRPHQLDNRLPKYVLDFIRFTAPEGERHQTLFRCAAYLTEQRAPPSLVFLLLTEPGLDMGLSPKDVERQLRCGIEHAEKQRGTYSTACVPMPAPDLDELAERQAIQSEADPLPPDVLSFPSGALAPQKSEGGAA